jgi:hypothetical protein
MTGLFRSFLAIFGWKTGQKLLARKTISGKCEYYISHESWHEIVAKEERNHCVFGELS